MQEGRSKKKKQPNNNLMSRNKLLLAERNMKNNCSDSEANTLTNTITNTNGRKRRQDGDNRDDGDCSNGTQATATTITPTLPENQQPNAVISFETALPTYTHWALAHMLLHPSPSLPRNVTDDAVVFDDDDDEVTIFTAKCNRKGVGATTATTNSAASATSVTTQCFPSPVQYIVTQNVDGLHRKTNIPRDKMSILHGCSKFTFLSLFAG